MKQKTLSIKQCYQVKRNLDAFLRLAEFVPGLLHFDLDEQRDDVVKHTDRADKIEKQMKQKYHFMWSNEDEDWDKKTEPVRVFDGSGRDVSKMKPGDAIEALKKRAEEDEKNFNKEWEKIEAQQKQVNYHSIDREHFDGIKARGVVTELLFIALRPFKEAIEDGKEKK